MTYITEYVLLTLLLLFMKMFFSQFSIRNKGSKRNFTKRKCKAMALHIFLSASLRRHVEDYDPRIGAEVSIEPNTTVAGVCESLGIPKTDVKIVMVNGKGRALSFKLTGDERVALFPPIGGG